MGGWKSALSKIGSVLANIAPAIPVVGGLVGGLLASLGKTKAAQETTVITGKVQDFSAVASGIVVDVESFGQALGIKGPDKLKAAVGPMVSALLASEAFYGNKIQDDALFAQGAQKIADGFADCWNAIHPDAVKVETPGQ